MTEAANFYNACIQNKAQPGFIADKVQMGGEAIGTMGAILGSCGNFSPNMGSMEDYHL